MIRSEISSESIYYLEVLKNIEMLGWITASLFVTGATN